MAVKKIFFLLCILIPSCSFSAEKTIICDEPQGTRVDYFTSNPINLKNETFTMSRDSVSGLKPRIIFNANGSDISFIIGDSAALAGQSKAGNMKLIDSTEDQITFAGKINNAPIMASYYTKANILIYTQQATWPGPDYTGARAMMFYARCKVEG